MARETALGGAFSEGRIRGTGSHGEGRRGAQTPEHRVWQSIIRRCYNPGQANYKYYGAKGIKVCDGWRGRGGYERFLAHIGRKPTARHQIDRIDSAGDYEPGNVRWVTPVQQQRNKHNNKLITANGKTQCVQAWVDETGLDHSVILSRIYRYGWPEDLAVTAPKGHQYRHGRWAGHTKKAA